MKQSVDREVKRRDEKFVAKTETKIWLEACCEDNPYIAENVYCHGYDILDLMENCNVIEVVFLLYKGELPSLEQREIFEKLFIGLINPGPRHAATRAAMNVGVGKTHPVHLLPIASMVMGGEKAAGEVESAMRFFRKSYRKPAAQVVAELSLHAGRDWQRPVPGFGQSYGGIDVLSAKLGCYLSGLPGAAEILNWGQEFSQLLAEKSAGWLSTGLAAAVFSDLGLHPKFAGPLYQLIAAPGLIAHGMEMYTKPLTAMPYVKDENYVVENRK